MKRTILIIGILCSALSIAALLLSYYYSGDKEQLFKLSIPMLILVILLVQMKQKPTTDTE